ncbi:hypothetical protein J6590_041117 [Homalodisca vitripennis]|nr:hypothetical protein J6590_041117 [Homalodisca vitripennis]
MVCVAFVNTATFTDSTTLEGRQANMFTASTSKHRHNERAVRNITISEKPNPLEFPNLSFAMLQAVNLEPMTDLSEKCQLKRCPLAHSPYTSVSCAYANNLFA